MKENGNKGLEEIALIIELRIAELMNVKPDNLTKEEFLERILEDLMRKETARDHLISPNKTRYERVTETIRSLKLYPNLKDLDIQVSITYEDEVKIINSEGADKNDFSDEVAIRFSLEEHGDVLVVDKNKKLTPYDMLLLKSHIDTLNLHIKNAFDYEKNFLYSTRDSLTDLYNKRYLEEFLINIYHIEKQKGINGMSLLFIDLDQLKLVNDTHPFRHDAGNLLIKGFAEYLKNSCRDRDILCRYGGDEFIVAMPETLYGNAIKRAKSLNETMKKQKFLFKSDITIPPVSSTISIGVSHTNFTSNYTELIQYADQLMYKAKELGKDRVEFLESIS